MYAIVKADRGQKVHRVTGVDGDLYELNSRDEWWTKDDLHLIDRSMIQRAVDRLYRKPKQNHVNSFNGRIEEKKLEIVRLVTGG